MLVTTKNMQDIIVFMVRIYSMGAIKSDLENNVENIKIETNRVITFMF